MIIIFSFLLDNNRDVWDVDQSRIDHLKEKYKRDRHGKQHHGINSTSARNNLFDDANDDISDQRAFSADEQSILLIYNKIYNRFFRFFVNK